MSSRYEKDQNAEKIKYELKAEHIVSFKAADFDRDNLLNVYEFKEYSERINEYKKERYGINLEKDGKQREVLYNAMNQIDTNVEGLSNCDFSRTNIILKSMIHD